MSKSERKGQRKNRGERSNIRVPKLGYYFIVTDTKETEKNYIHGLRDSIPEKLRGKLVIKVVKTETKNLVNEAMNMASINPQYGEPWIIFDRDQVQNFDNIIKEAEEKGIRVGWANPCIEAWFHAYFGAMPTYRDSVDCCNKFGKIYAKVTNQDYEKANDEIYSKLVKHGNEEHAICIAEQKIQQHISNNTTTPSKMSPCTTIHVLVKEIKSKVKES